MSTECVMSGNGDGCDFDTSSCKVCGNAACLYHFVKCGDCEAPICDSCRGDGLKECPGCVKDLCLEHFGRCARCDELLCDDRCLNNECSKCGASFCDGCVNMINHDTVCKNCVPYDS